MAETIKGDGNGPDATPIVVRSYDSADEPAANRHDAWAARSWPSVASVFQSRPIGAFSTAADSVRFDGMVVQYAEGTARDLTRTLAQTRSDGIDVLGVGVQIDAPMHGFARDRPFFADTGAILLLDTAQPSTVTIPTGRSIQLAIPRGVADEHFGPVRKLHGAVIVPDRATMLVSHLHRIREAMPVLTDPQQPRLARTVLDLLAIAMEQVADLPPAEREDRKTPTKAMAQRVIESRLGLPSLTVAMLCQHLQMSRSVLYRMFEVDGGIEAYIRKRRLEQVRQELLDPRNGDRIGDLAFRWGFSDASHLSRQFRETFGTTPTALRATREAS